MKITIAIFGVLFIIFTGFYIFYYIFGKIYGDEKNLEKYRNLKYQPKISIITATYNERKIIKNKIENLQQIDYPKNKIEIVFVDCSTDNTYDILKKFKKETELHIKLIHEEERKGLSHALNLGYSNASGDVIVKSDCDITMKRDSIKELVSFLGNKEIGGVTGFGIPDIDLEKAYRDIQQKLRIAESNFHSTYLFDTFCAFKKQLIEPISEDSVADDAEMALNIIRKDYKTVINPKAVFYENCPKKFSERRKQKDRRAEGHIRLLIRNMDMLFNCKYGRFGLIIFPAIFFMMIVSPWLFLANIIFFILMLWTLLGYYSLIIIVLSIIVFAASYKLSFPSKLESFIDSQLSLIVAQLRVLFRKSSHKWEKVER